MQFKVDRLVMEGNYQNYRRKKPRFRVLLNRRDRTYFKFEKSCLSECVCVPSVPCVLVYDPQKRSVATPRAIREKLYRFSQVYEKKLRKKSVKKKSRRRNKNETEKKSRCLFGYMLL